MPQLKQPASLYDNSLQVLASRIRRECDEILSNNVSTTALKDRYESLNRRLQTEIPASILDAVRRLRNLSVFLYFDSTSLEVRERTPRETKLHRHIVANVSPHLGNVTFLDLAKVEGTLDLYKAIGDHCPNLLTIYVPHCGYESDEALEFGIGLLCLSSCKRLRAIRSGRSLHSSEIFLTSMEYCCCVYLLLQLPELTEFCWSLASTLVARTVRDGVYSIERLFIGDDFFTNGEQIRWLDGHCPRLRDLACDIDSEDDADSIFRALADGKLELEALKLSPQVPPFEQAMRLFFANKGTFLRELFLRYGFFYSQAPTGLSHSDLVTLSECCPSLRRLTLKKDWHNASTSISPRRRDERLFPRLEHLDVNVRPRYDAILPALLDDLTQLRTLSCRFLSGTRRTFLDSLVGLKNGFARLTDVNVTVCCQDDVTAVTAADFLGQLLVIAMDWPVVGTIRAEFLGLGATVEAEEYVEEMRSRLREENVDLTIVVKWKKGQVYEETSGDEYTSYTDSDSDVGVEGDENSNDVIDVGVDYDVVLDARYIVSEDGAVDNSDRDLGSEISDSDGKVSYGSYDSGSNASGDIVNDVMIDVIMSK